MSHSKRIITLEDGFKCFWTIGDFIRCKPNEGLLLKSPNFKVIMLLDSEWYLAIEICKNNFNVFLFKKEGLSFFSNIHYSVFIHLSTGWYTLLKCNRKKFQSNGEGHGIINLRWNEWNEETLTLCFHMWNGNVKGKSAQCVISSKMITDIDILHLPVQEFSTLTPSDFNNFPTLSFRKSDTKVEVHDKSIQTDVAEDCDIFKDFDDLLRLFREKKFQSITLRTEGKEFIVQKAILCARSPVFNAMFDTDMKENDSNNVDIEDIDGDTFSLLLQFLHLEPLGDLKWDSAVKLFYAADKYQIMQLKSSCVSILKKELNEENVCEALIMADMHNEGELMQSAMEFFCKKSRSIIHSSNWKDLTLNKTQLASEVLCKMAEMLVSSNNV